MELSPTYRTPFGIVLLLLAGGCSFDTSNRAAADDGGGGATGDDSGDTLGTRPDAIAPEDCPEDIHLQISIAGAAAASGPGEPFVHALLGDTIELSAVGSCTRTGIIEYRWSVEPVASAIGDTALPNLTSEIISVVTTQAGQSTVRLTIGDGNTTKQTLVYAFETHEFEPIASYPGARVRDLGAGANFLWVGADDGAYRGDLTNPNGTYSVVNDLYGGDDMPSNLRVHEAAAGDNVWFGSDDSEGLAYRLDLAAGSISTLDTIENARTREIDDAETGIRFATNQGVALAADSSTFVLEREDDSDALSFGATGSFAGGNRLYPLPNEPEIDLFGGDDRIQSLDEDGTTLWIGTDSEGVSTFFGGALQTTYKTDNSDLPSNDVETIAIDARQDIWVGTPSGVARFKRDRQIWIPMTANSGLGESLDIDAIEVDDGGGRRAIYVGGRDGLFVMRIP